VDSIRRQTFADFELLILDDASTDETPALARALEQEDERIRYIRHEQNVGHLTNYNLGIEQSRGELIWLISADDCLASERVLEDFVNAFKQYPRLGFAFSRVQCIDADSTPYEKYIPRKQDSSLPYQPTLFPGHALFKLLLPGNFIPAPGAIARKACYEQYGHFHPALTHSGDWYNWLLFSLDWDVYYDPSPRVYYRKHQQNMHMTYEKPRHALENSLLCYTELEAYLKARKYPRELRRQVLLAKLQFKRKNGFDMSVPEKLLRLYGKLTRHYA
jgi:glycosyltransferase involved in cell wall biosynthesis